MLESGGNDNEATAEDDDEGFGDDFDDFEEGQEAEDADFGEFDDGFQDEVQSPTFEPSAAPPAPTQPMIVSTRRAPFRYRIESTHDHWYETLGIADYLKSLCSTLLRCQKTLPLNRHRVPRI